jgi:HSP20 family protein
MNKKMGDRHGSGGIDLGLGGIVRGLGDLIEKLNELSETGQELSQTGEIRQGEHVKGIYGFSVKVGLGGKPSIEPFGNLYRDTRSGRTVVQEVREPMVDVIEEEDYVLVLAEMPGISAEDVRVEVKDDLLTVAADKKGKRYRKEILLPGNFVRERMQISCNNGVLEIKCLR